MGKHKTTSLTDIDKPIYSYRKALYASFFDFRLYVDVVKRWRGLGISYLFLAILIFCLPLSIKITYQFNAFFNHDILKVIQAMPPLIIQQGKVSIQQTTPYLIKNEQGETVGIIDPNVDKGAYAMEKNPTLMLLVTRSYIYYRAPVFKFFNPQIAEKLEMNNVYYQAIPKASNEIFDGKAFLAYAKLNQISYLALGIIYPVIVSIFGGLYTVFFLTFGVLAQFIAKLILKAYLTYIQTCRILIVSATPALLLLITLFTCDLTFTGSGSLIVALLAIYFSLATIAYRRQAQKLVRQ